MNLNNIEIKARCHSLENVEHIIELYNAEFIGEDFQTDTYYLVKKGRLKLREGNIEKSLIYYERKNESGPKRSDVELVKLDKTADLKRLLDKLFEILIVVKKKRKIYFLNNVKFHVDQVEHLGSFIEIEAINDSGQKPQIFLRDQCNHYIDLFGINKDDFITHSYSDLLLNGV